MDPPWAFYFFYPKSRKLFPGLSNSLLVNENGMNGNILITDPRCLDDGIKIFSHTSGYGKNCTYYFYQVRKSIEEIMNLMKEITENHKLLPSSLSLGTCRTKSGEIGYLNLDEEDDPEGILMMTWGLGRDQYLILPDFEGEIKFWVSPLNYTYLIGNGFYSVLG